MKKVYVSPVCEVYEIYERTAILMTSLPMGGDTGGAGFDASHKDFIDEEESDNYWS